MSKFAIFDNHDSHLSTAIIDLKRENGVTIVTFSSQSTHTLQCLLVEEHNTSKTYYSAVVGRQMIQCSDGVLHDLY
jgi:hypothetical protein